MVYRWGSQTPDISPGDYLLIQPTFMIPYELWAYIDKDTISVLQTYSSRVTCTH